MTSLGICNDLSFNTRHLILLGDICNLGVAEISWRKRCAFYICPLNTTQKFVFWLIINVECIEHITDFLINVYGIDHVHNFIVLHFIIIAVIIIIIFAFIIVIHFY